MVDLRKALAGLGSRSRGNLSVLISSRDIAEVEAMLVDNPRVEWTVAFETKCDQVSLAVFGITKSDTLPKELHPDDVPDEKGWSRWFSAEAFAVYGDRLDRWYAFMKCIGAYQGEAEKRGRSAYWCSRGYDVTSPDGGELRCLPHFELQLYAAVTGLLPGAKVTLDGSGKRAGQSVEDWAAALEAEAKRFRPTR